eukprot:TRINITY_DN35948_c0_g1_i1.p1 TRINITY_DN35948_c0_g1~~TRINITY_DN35948_c0_g1_i1.p1  ORF type:complete len:1341 (+),score=130.35 TRINITY_DN35948_c0_g1_i1:106-4128(+)
MSGNERFKVVRDGEDATITCHPGFQQAIAQLQPFFPEYALAIERLVQCQQSVVYNRTHVFCRKTFCERFADLYGKYQKVTAVWHRLLNYVTRFAVIRGFCVDDDCLGCLTLLYNKCVELDTAVLDLLAAARDRFPRFYLLIDAQLLELLGSPLRAFATKQDEACMPPLSNLFDFHSLVLQDSATGQPQCIGVRGRDGVIFFLDEPVNQRDNLLDLFERVTTGLRLSLHKAVKQALSNSPLLRNPVTTLSPRHALLPKHLLLHHPPQVAELLLRLRFTATVEEFLMKGVSLHDLLRQEDAILKAFSNTLSEVAHPSLASPTSGVASPGLASVHGVHSVYNVSGNSAATAARKTMMAREAAEQKKVLNRLLAIQMQHVLIVKYLISEGAETQASPCWKEQLRFYWSDVRETVMIDVDGVDVEYGFSYHDWADPTPTTMPSWDTAKKILQAYRQPSIINLCSGSVGGMQSVVENVSEIARMLGRYCNVVQISPEGTLMFNTDGSNRIVGGIGGAAGNTAGNSAASGNSNIGMGKLRPKKGGEMPQIRAVNGAPIVGHRTGRKEFILKLLAGCFSTGCWVVLEGLEQCNVSVRAAVRHAFESYATALERGGEHSTMIMHQLLRTAAPSRPPTNNSATNGVMPGNPPGSRLITPPKTMHSNSSDMEDHVGTKLTVQTSVLITCTPSDEEQSGNSVLFADSRVTNPALLDYVDKSMESNAQVTDKIKSGFAHPGQLAIIIPTRTAHPATSIPQTLATCANFSVVGARSAANQFQEVMNFMQGFTRNVKKAVPMTESFYRSLCGVSVYTNGTTDTSRLSASLKELEAFALAVHALILPRLPEEEAKHFLSELHNKILYGAVDFLWLYSLCQQNTRNALMAAVHSKGLQLAALTELWRPDTPPGVAGIAYIASMSNNKSATGQLSPASPPGPAASQTPPSPHRNQSQVPPGGARKKPPAPQDNYITRMQAILLTLRASAYLSLETYAQSNAATSAGPFSPTYNISASLAPPRHLIITGDRGEGKTLSFYLLRTVMFQLSFTTLTSTVLYGDTEQNGESMMDGHVVKLSLHAGTTLSEGLGVVHPGTLAWLDGSLTQTIRYAISVTQPYLDSAGDGNVAVLNNITDTTALAELRRNQHGPNPKKLIQPQHFWIHINSAPPPALSEAFHTLLSNNELSLPTGEVLIINPYVHFVFEIPLQQFRSLPPLLCTQCLVLSVPKGAFKQQAKQKKSAANSPMNLAVMQAGPGGTPKLDAVPDEVRSAAFVARDISGAIVAEDDMRAAFERLDTNGNGWVSKAEFKKAYATMEHFGMGYSECARLESMLKDFHFLDDDKLSYDEFAVAMLKLAQR